MQARKSCRLPRGHKTSVVDLSVNLALIGHNHIDPAAYFILPECFYGREFKAARRCPSTRYCQLAARSNC